VNGALVGTDTYFYDHEAPLDFSSRNNRLMRVDRTSAAGTLLSSVFFFYENPFGNVSRIVRRAAGSTHFDSTVLLYAEDASPWLAWDESWDNFGAGPVNVVRGNVLETRQSHGSARLWRLRSGTTLAPLPGAEWIADGGNVRSIFGVGTGGAITPLELEFYGAQRLATSGASYDMEDVVGSTRITSAGGVTTSQDYTAFGERLSSSGSVPTHGFAGAFGVRQGFGGQALTSSNLVAMGYRWYSPEFGRFLMRDPISIGGGLNVYAFTSSQPTYRVDPQGLAPHGGQYRGPVDIPLPPVPGTGAGPAPLPPPPRPPPPPFRPPDYSPPSRPPLHIPPPGPRTEPDFIGPPLPQPGDPNFIGPLEAPPLPEV
jgi:RHS repeat-associated protein